MDSPGGSSKRLSVIYSQEIELRPNIVSNYMTTIRPTTTTTIILIMRRRQTLYSRFSSYKARGVTEDVTSSRKHCKAGEVEFDEETAVLIGNQVIL